VTNTAGDEVAFYGYDAFGTLAFGTPVSPFGYSGQYSDAASGLVNDRARFYEPSTGAFMTRDPAFDQTDTAYTYAGDDPVNASDPSGLDAAGCTGAFPGLSGTFGYCISISGDGTIVNQIHTSAYTPYSGCSVAEVLINGVPTFRAPEVCYKVANESVNQIAPDPTVLFAGRHLAASWGCPNIVLGGGFTDGVNTSSPQCSQTYRSNGITPFKAGDQVCEEYVGTGISGNPNRNGSTPRACETIGSNTSEYPLGFKRLPPLPRLPNPLPPLPGFSPGYTTAAYESCGVGDYVL
jgi:RHS repeat-associated protein